MRFCWSTLKVRSMDESIAFYENILGLTVNQRFKAGPDMEIAFMGKGETQIELIHDRNKTEIEIGQDISWGFEVDSLEKMMSVLEKNGITIHEGPYQPNPSTRFFYVLDPNGMKIQMVENLNQKVRG